MKEDHNPGESEFGEHVDETEPGTGEPVFGEDKKEYEEGEAAESAREGGADPSDDEDA